MKYTIEYREKEGYILLQVEGDQYGSHMKHAFHLVVEMAEETGCHRYFVDMSRSEVKDSIADTYMFNATLHDTGVKKSDRISGLFRSQTRQHRFSETAAQNQGWNLRFFEDREEALRWLLEDFI